MLWSLHNIMYTQHGFIIWICKNYN